MRQTWGKAVASHLRSHQYGYTTDNSHMASNARVIMERSAASYVARAERISKDCGDYIKEVFNPSRTNQPEEVYYKLCDAVLSLSRKYDRKVFDLSCRQCREYGIYRLGKFDAVIKNNALKTPDDEPILSAAPTPTDHANMRGSAYFDEVSSHQ